MTSIKAAKLDVVDHTTVAVYAGPDAEHRAHCGTLTMLPEEAAELIARIDAGEPGSGDITPKIARHVLWHFGEPGGYEPGSFTKALIYAIASADITHRARLALGYNAHVVAVDLAQNTDGGVALLQKIAREES